MKGMISSIIQMAETTLAIITFSILGVTGVIDGAEHYNGTIAFHSDYIDVSIGGFVVSGGHTLTHEYGHYLQRNKYGSAGYILFVAVPSFASRTLSEAGLMQYDYASPLWFEAEATELGVQALGSTY